MAMSVLDITPNGVSSVYFMYETEWDRFSMGKAGIALCSPEFQLTTRAYS